MHQINTFVMYLIEYTAGGKKHCFVSDKWNWCGLENINIDSRNLDEWSLFYIKKTGALNLFELFLNIIRDIIK